jgi:hypothetical protein
MGNAIPKTGTFLSCQDPQDHLSLQIMEIAAEETKPVAAPWHRWLMGKNRYDVNEFAGSFGDLGTLIPFVVGYVVVLGILGFAMWNMGVAFVAGIILHQVFERRWIKL